MPEIVRQSDYYGLESRQNISVPPSERVADLLRPAPLWEGPSKVERD